MRIFHEGDLSEHLRRREAALKQEIQQEPEEHALGADERQLVEYFATKHRIDPLVLDFDGVYATDSEAMVRAEDFPSGGFWNVSAGKQYKKTKITFHIPFSGEAELLRYRPSSRILWTEEVTVGQGEVSFAVIAFRESDAEIVNRESKRTLDSIKQQYGNVSREVTSFNDGLTRTVEGLVRARKEALLRRRNLVGALEVPVRRRDPATVPVTFSVPVTKKPVIVKPSVPPEGKFVPEPALADTVYQEILKLIRVFGVEMERHPGLYAGKDEETLRDYLLLVLAPHFQSVTGETFNKGGKTDILIRHEKSNVFVAECKFWRGQKSLVEAIDQVLGYLTWRDSKAAVICFVKNREIAAVVDQIERTAAQHPCHVRSGGKVAEGWYSFAFHLRGDASRAVALSVLCFHFPEQEES